LSWHLLLLPSNWTEAYVIKPQNLSPLTWQAREIMITVFTEWRRSDYQDMLDTDFVSVIFPEVNIYGVPVEFFGI